MRVHDIYIYIFLQLYMCVDIYVVMKLRFRTLLNRAKEVCLWVGVLDTRFNASNFMKLVILSKFDGFVCRARFCSFLRYNVIRRNTRIFNHNRAKEDIMFITSS